MSRRPVFPQCAFCEHADGSYFPYECKAFPTGIPDLIRGEVDEDYGRFYRYDHREPLAGDNDIQFKPRESLSEDELIELNNTIDELMMGRIWGTTLPRLGK
jgi:hypothetical protein